MPTYILELPEEGETKALLINLVGTLEKLENIVTFDALGVMLPAEHPAGELMAKYAKHVIPDLLSICETLNAPIDAVIGKSEQESIAEALKAPAPNDHCEECGAPFIKHRKDSRYCSKECLQRAYQRNYQRKKKEENKPTGVKGNGSLKNSRDGSGVVHGKLILGKNR